MEPSGIALEGWWTGVPRLCLTTRRARRAPGRGGQGAAPQKKTARWPCDLHSPLDRRYETDGLLPPAAGRPPPLPSRWRRPRGCYGKISDVTWEDGPALARGRVGGRGKGVLDDAAGTAPQPVLPPLPPAAATAGGGSPKKKHHRPGYRGESPGGQARACRVCAAVHGTLCRPVWPCPR